MSMNITYIDSCSKWEDDDDEKKRNDFVVSEGGGKVVFNIKWVECHRCLANKTIFSFGYCSKPTFMFVLSLALVFFIYFLFLCFIPKSDTLEMKGKILFFFLSRSFEENKSKSGCILCMRTKVYLFFSFSSLPSQFLSSRS